MLRRELSSPCVMDLANRAKDSGKDGKSDSPSLQSRMCYHSCPPGGSTPPSRESLHPSPGRPSPSPALHPVRAMTWSSSSQPVGHEEFPW